MLERIFDLFTQVDRSLERAQGGLGIGLTIVRQLVEMHGGTVEARSEGIGKGSEFILRIPLEPPSRAPTAVASTRDERALAARPAARRVLVVDDNIDAADSLKLLLRFQGHDVKTAHDGLAGVEAAADFRPDIVFLDLGMPRLNGLDAARRIREAPWGRAMILVALTGWGQAEDLERARVAGFNHHLVKPIDAASLERILGAPKRSEPPRDG
jgi:CheY-like chemotaxis protein